MAFVLIRSKNVLKVWMTDKYYNYVKVILLSWNLYNDISDVVKRENILICHNGLPPIAHKVEWAMLRDVYSGSECVTTVIIKFSL